jgi:hypothetical protein
VTVRDALGASAVFSYGELRASDGTVFVNNTAVRNGVFRLGEDSVPAGTAADPPLHGAQVSSVGGAVTAMASTSAVITSDTSFTQNVAKGSAVTNMGGALFLLGGASTFTSTSFRYNHVEPARLIARGGGAYMIYGVMSIDAAEFIGNEVRAVAGSSGTAGAPKTCTQAIRTHARGAHARTHAHTHTASSPAADGSPPF